jgi:hypothetical protein
VAEDSPSAAARAHVSLLQDALHCVTQAPLSFQGSVSISRIRAEQPYAVALRNLRPVPLDGPFDVELIAGQAFRIRRYVGLSSSFGIEMISCFYSIATADHIEILTFQWTPEATHSKTFPHVHVGRAIVSDKTLIMPERFRKVHIPTGHVTLAAVARMAIEEFQVKPLTRRWSAVLDDSEHAELGGLDLLPNRNRNR